MEFEHVGAHQNLHLREGLVDETVNDQIQAIVFQSNTGVKQLQFLERK